MSLMNSIQQWGNTPMNFINPMAPPALSGNPEIAKAAQYSGGGGQPTLAAPAAPAAGGAPAGAGAPAGGSGIMDSIMKLLGGGGGGGNGMDIGKILSMIGMAG